MCFFPIKSIITLKKTPYITSADFDADVRRTRRHCAYFLIPSTLNQTTLQLCELKGHRVSSTRCLSGDDFASDIAVNVQNDTINPTVRRTRFEAL